MKETVSVEDAINRGHLIITLPSFIIMVGGAIFFVYLNSEKNLSQSNTLLGVFLSFIISWAYWSIMITKWRLWAFDKVRNVHELRKLAIQEKIIWPKESIFEKTEIRTKADREKWNLLQDKFNQLYFRVYSYFLWIL